MDCFLKRSTPASSPAAAPSAKRPATAAKQGCKTAAERAVEFGKTSFYIVECSIGSAVNITIVNTTIDWVN